jgi:hypothetical protein
VCVCVKGEVGRCEGGGGEVCGWRRDSARCQEGEQLSEPRHYVDLIAEVDQRRGTGRLNSDAIASSPCPLLLLLPPPPPPPIHHLLRPSRHDYVSITHAK